MATIRTKAERRRLVRQYRRSGLTQREFAAKQGLNSYSLSRWIQQFPEEAVVDGPKTEFTELVSYEARQVEALPPPPTITIQLGGVSLQLSTLLAPEYLAQVVRAYEEVRSC